MSDTEFGKEVFSLFAKESKWQKANDDGRTNFFKDANEAIDKVIEPVFAIVMTAHSHHKSIAKMRINHAHKNEGKQETETCSLVITDYTGNEDSIAFVFSLVGGSCVRIETIDGEETKESPMPAHEYKRETVERVTLSFLKRVFDEKKPRLPVA